jgi:hypothetical protein
LWGCSQPRNFGHFYIYSHSLPFLLHPLSGIPATIWPQLSWGLSYQNQIFKRDKRRYWRSTFTFRRSSYLRWICCQNQFAERQRFGGQSEAFLRFASLPDGSRAPPCSASNCRRKRGPPFSESVTAQCLSGYGPLEVLKQLREFSLERVSYRVRFLLRGFVTFAPRGDLFFALGGAAGVAGA